MTGQELWKSDGTAGGTVLVKDIDFRPGGSSSSPRFLTNVNGTLFFSAEFFAFDDVGSTGRELWKSDGTAAGTMLVKDIWPGSRRSSPRELTNVNGTLFFVADDGVTGAELWKSDGTLAGTMLVKGIFPGVGFETLFPRELTNVNGTLFFSAHDSVSGFELWKSDGTAAGTMLVKDILPGGGSSSPELLTNVNGTLFFVARGLGSAGRELWKSDGTLAGTILVKDIRPGFGSSTPRELTNVNGTLFFSATDSVSGFEPWKSDGTAVGTVLAADIFPGSTSLPAEFTPLGFGVLFAATDGVTGRELWSFKIINQAPVADAGSDQLVTVAPGNTAMVTLDGSGSFDPDGDPLTFTWTNSFGTVLGVTPTVPLAAGVHIITLTVDDGKGGTDTDTVEITVNQAPVARAGPNQVVQVPLGGTADVTLDGSGSSDPDGDSLIYTWTNSFGTVMGVMPTVTLAPGVHRITLTIDDGNGGTDSDTVEITVNQPPTADAGTDQLVTVAPGDTAMVTLDGSGSSDPETAIRSPSPGPTRSAL